MVFFPFFTMRFCGLISWVGQNYPVVNHNVVAVQNDIDHAPELVFLNLYPVGLDVVQIKHVVLICKYAISAINNLRFCIIPPSQRKAHGAHKHVGFAVSDRTASER
jgi:hypothetical protein